MNNNIRSIKREKQKDADKSASLTISIGQLASSRPILHSLLAQKFPEGKGKQSLNFGRLCRDVFKELETAYDPAYSELLKKHGEEQKENPGTYTFKKEAIEQFNKETAELNSAEVILLHKAMPELLDIFSLSGSDALILEWLVG